MEELNVRYTLSRKYKFFAFTAGGYLLALSLGVGIKEALADRYQFIFYAGVVGAVIALLLLMSVTVWLSDLLIAVDNQEFRVKLPHQKMDGVIDWGTVSQVGIGLSFLTLTTPDKTYKIDMGNVKYNDLKDIKTKVLEVCESRNIPYSNV